MIHFRGNVLRAPTLQLREGTSSVDSRTLGFIAFKTAWACPSRVGLS